MDAKLRTYLLGTQALRLKMIKISHDAAYSKLLEGGNGYGKNQVSLSGILSIVLIVGMFFLHGCASKNNASQLNTNVSNLQIHQMHASLYMITDNIREAVGICDYVFVAKGCQLRMEPSIRNVITTEDEKEILREVGLPYTNYTIQVLKKYKR